MTKDDWGGWNVSFPVVRNDPGRGPVIIRVGSHDVQVHCGDAGHSLYIEALIAMEIGSGNTALWTMLTFVASLHAGGPAMIFGCVPTKKGMLQMTSASRLSPKEYPRATSVSLRRQLQVHYHSDVDSGFHYFEAEGTALDIDDITGSAHSRITQCLKSTKPRAGFDQDMMEFEDLAGLLTPDGTAREAPEAEPTQEDLPKWGRPRDSDIEETYHVP
eukprot:4027368-Pyramimonas_sp.AAC.1